MAAGDVCVVCGNGLGFSWAVDHFGESMCHACSRGARCWSCSAATGGSGARARSVLDDGRTRCGRCSAWAVDRQSDVGAVVSLVRPLLHSYGIRLPNRVRVELTSPDQLGRHAGTSVHGLTSVVRSGGTSQVARMRVMSGMPATQFGQVLAHEMGHAWLALCPGAGIRSARDEEGLCELVASWWLRHRGGRLARYYLDNLSSNPDPVYGDGYREVERRASARPPHEIVKLVTATGRI
ncbi:protein DA1 [Saccharothrix carnea]|uniref:Protein DA1 n=1 Tax=Saccharothrix carnea TaxID=1280637 RepID=A0A2P8I4H0_SACCR|nr:protein DA1 [Saccharothrix carnea]PSL53369.1 protein DA1 [Saccharothrix carnea]